ncbi:hypothetical protein C8R43DRAFT_965518 [Mycena crocata]|nr:hypothetical protein C8R43DRAFT_965518 [Mycena crocata]
MANLDVRGIQPGPNLLLGVFPNREFEVVPSEEQLFTGEEKLVATESDQFAHNADYAHREHSSNVNILTPRCMLPMQLSKRISNPTTSRSRKVLFCPSLTKLGVQFQTNESQAAPRLVLIASQEPPQRVIEVLIDTFLQRFAGSAYFFLEPVSFRQSALLPFPPGHSSRPSASLLNAVYLWGSYLSSDAGHYTEDDFLALVLHNSVHDLSAIDAEGIIIQLIQTEVLLSFWYLNSCQPLQGRRHCSVALSLASSSGFQIHSVHQKSVADHPPTEISKALGSILLLDEYWVIASDIPSNFLFNPAPFPQPLRIFDDGFSGGSPSELSVIAGEGVRYEFRLVVDQLYADQMASDIILANVSDWGWAEPVLGPVISRLSLLYHQHASVAGPLVKYETTHHDPPLSLVHFLRDILAVGADDVNAISNCVYEYEGFTEAGRK